MKARASKRNLANRKFTISDVPREEWDFSLCPRDELFECRAYEFAREASVICKDVKSLRKGVAPIFDHQDVMSDLKQKPELENLLIDLTEQASNLVKQASAHSGQAGFDRGAVMGLLETSSPPPVEQPAGERSCNHRLDKTVAANFHSDPKRRQ